MQTAVYKVRDGCVVCRRHGRVWRDVQMSHAAAACPSPSLRPLLHHRSGSCSWFTDDTESMDESDDLDTDDLDNGDGSRVRLL